MAPGPPNATPHGGYLDDPILSVVCPYVWPGERQPATQPQNETCLYNVSAVSADFLVTKQIATRHIVCFVFFDMAMAAAQPLAGMASRRFCRCDLDAMLQMFQRNECTHIDTDIHTESRRQTNRHTYRYINTYIQHPYSYTDVADVT